MAKYSILYIPTGSYIQIEIYYNGVTIPFKLIKSSDVFNNKYTINYFASYDYAKKYHADYPNKRFFQLVAEDEATLSTIIQESRLCGHIYMDIYEVKSLNGYGDQILKSEFAVVEVEYAL